MSNRLSFNIRKDADGAPKSCTDVVEYGNPPNFYLVEWDLKEGKKCIAAGQWPSQLEAIAAYSCDPGHPLEWSEWNDGN